MKLELRELNRAIFSALAFGSVAALAAMPVVAQDEDEGEASRMTTVEVTGSRIKRTDAEGSVPITVIDRQQLELSGDVSVADYLRNTTFNSFGSFRPQSGSSAQAHAEIELRGIGAARTLVLIDGRRAPINPAAGQGQDLNSIPMAAVERIEILTDGASAIYGSDAIGGVVNIITRRDFNGVELMVGASDPKRAGGETEEGSVIFGTSGDRGNMIAGMSYSNRGIIWQRDRPWSAGPGASTYANNYVTAFAAVDNPDPNSAFDWIPFSFAGGNTPQGSIVPGGCSGPGFRTGVTATGAGRCLYDFTFVAADEAELRNSSLFTRANYEINDDWQAYLNASVSRVESFGRYAPVADYMFLPPNSPNNPSANPMYVFHRFASLGNRDNQTDSNTYDVLLGFQGRIGSADVDFGIRRNEFKFLELGRNYMVRPIAEAYAATGAYNIYNPMGNPENILNAMKATINRESAFIIEELYANATLDLFEMGGGVAGLAFGAEYRDETYYDNYDSLSEAGVIGGSAGNSAGGGRSVGAAFAEILLPVMDNLEISGAIRYDRYSDYGSDVSPKISVLFRPIDSLVIRGSYGQGFRAPTLDILTQKTAFSADSVVDPQTALAFGVDPEDTVQINAYRIANPTLSSEQSKQFSVGLAWDAASFLNLSLDYWNIKVEDSISFFGSQDLINRQLEGRPIPPGLGVTRFPDGSIQRIDTGYSNEGEVHIKGLDLNVRTNFDLGDFGALRNQFQLSYFLDYTIDDSDDLVGTNNRPEFRAALQNEYTFGDFSFGWNINHIDQHAKAASNGTVTLPSWTTHDVQATWNAPWNGRLTLGMQNVLDKDPVLDSADTSGRGFAYGLYDAYGRVPYFRYTQSF